MARNLYSYLYVISGLDELHCKKLSNYVHREKLVRLWPSCCHSRHQKLPLWSWTKRRQSQMRRSSVWILCREETFWRSVFAHGTKIIVSLETWIPQQKYFWWYFILKFLWMFLCVWEREEKKLIFQVTFARGTCLNDGCYLLDTNIRIINTFADVTTHIKKGKSIFLLYQCFHGWTLGFNSCHPGEQ